MRKLTQEEFIKKCHSLWGDTYDLSKTAYIDSRSKITVVCLVHGGFEVKANNFVTRMSGCPVCGGQAGKTLLQFIEDARKVHKDRYDYSRSSYQRYDAEITIVCPDHGPFKQLPYVHLRGSGCPSCSTRKRVETDDFISRAKVLYGDKYLYEKTEYTVAANEVTITCRTHGDFDQLPHNHLAGRGCPGCAKTGYNSLALGSLYALASADRQLMKIGLSNFPEKRMRQLATATPFSFDVIGFREMNGKIASRLEKYIHKMCISAGLMGFEGCTEWFKYDEQILRTFKP